jgi:phage terminase large subunit GpA-like protein
LSLTLKVFTTCTLALPWQEEGATVDESALMRRVEPIGLDRIPRECTHLTLGCDCADDRLELVICGWTREGVCAVLAHEVIHGGIDDDLTWRQLDDILRQRFAHPLGGTLGIDAAVIDGGDGQHLGSVLAFCRPRSARRIMCGKGASGFSRPPLLASRSKMRGGGRLWIIGSDGVKLRLFDRLQRGSTVRFSDELTATFFEQLASERVEVRQVGGKPTRRFVRIKGRAAEVLDAVTYAWAAKSALSLTAAAFSQREDDLRRLPSAPPPSPRPSVIRSQWMER